MKVLRTTCSVFFFLLPLLPHLHSQSVSTTFQSPLLYVSTLDGTFYAIDVPTGLVRWKIAEEKVVNIPKDFQKDQKFFPDPSDGSLYIVNRGSIEKLTHTIPEMVHTSPTRTRGGLLYAGKKTDYWVSLNPDNGAKKASVTTDGIETCTALTKEGSNLYVGKTEYSLTIVDSKTATQTWNVTYVRYIAPDLADTNYEFTHYASSSDGTLVTFHTGTNALLWHIRLTSPIISMFIERYGSLLKIPFRTLASDTVTSYILRDIRSLIVDGQADVTRMLFIGRYAGGIYAMNEMMHNRDMYMPRPNYPKIGATVDEDIAQGNVRTVGRHALPNVPPSLLLTQDKHEIIWDGVENTALSKYQKAYYQMLSFHEHQNALQLLEDPNTIPASVTDSNSQEDKMQFYILVAVSIMGLLVCIVVVSLVVMCTMIRSMKNSPQPTPQNREVKEKPKHVKSVGKIDIYMSDIIGHGSEGTVVYNFQVVSSFVRDLSYHDMYYKGCGLLCAYKKSFNTAFPVRCLGPYMGMFEKREVAVKRVILDFIDIDMHEVELLRQADEHPNVIRYFCMETDSSFRYLALELCQASLRDYVENTLFPRTKGENTLFPRTKGRNKTLLSQTIAGIRHLHSLNIVHRDIKPGNILIQKCTKRSYTLKAVISDFGLCRKISDGRQSMTARTGSAGTDGWIAPEMLLPSKKISCAVDVFSYGCIMYYVLSNGNHPFGNDVYRRQANILNFDFDLSALSEPCQDNVLAVSLICKMVGNEPIERPTANAVYMHPYFWNPHKQLQFYSDVSDRVEKEENSDLVLRWEHNTLGPVLRGGWMNQCPELEQDLYKYRKYRSDSIRDLLRAMRNKRHHYRELPPELLKTLGDIPDGYVNYFASRFPRLLLHTHTIMAECCNESLFKSHYPEIATFREERREMSRYTPQTSDEVSSSVGSKVALNERGEYAVGEVIKQPLKLPLKSKITKKQKAKNGKGNSGVSTDEVLSWRRSSRTESESSDQIPDSRTRSSDFKPLSESKQPRYEQSEPVYITDTVSEDVKTPTNDVNGSTPPGMTGSPRPWFKQYSVAVKGGVLSKRNLSPKLPTPEKA